MKINGLTRLFSKVDSRMPLDGLKKGSKQLPASKEMGPVADSFKKEKTPYCAFSGEILY